MKKFAIGGIVVLLLGGYVLWSASRQATTSPTTTSPNNNKMMRGIGMPMMNLYKDGTYTGTVGSATPYGNVQVRATILGGKLTSVITTEAPHGPGRTDELTAVVFPALEKEAIAKQSANVDIYSGATQDTEGFQVSLGSILVQAKN